MIDKHLSGNQLKLIAAVSMLADHVGYLLIGDGTILPLKAEGVPYAFWWIVYLVCRVIGKAAFPIFAFLLVEGYFHTRNWRKYALRLGIFALVSEIPFDLVDEQKLVSWRMQNVFFALLLGLLMIRILEHIRRHMAGEIGLLLQLLVIGLSCGCAWAMHVDYDYIGIMMIALCYWFRQEREQLCMMGFVWMGVMMRHIYYLPGYAAAFLLIWFYNGKRGGRKIKQYGFYLFYPVHLVILYLIYKILF